jgi:NAD(P)H-dependent FMN reductase
MKTQSLETPIKFLAICGSLRVGSYTDVLVRTLSATIVAEGAVVSVWSLLSDPLPMANPIYHKEPQNHPDTIVRRFVHLADAADGFILGSPIYHNSFSGCLKNSLDLLAMSNTAYKTFGLVSHGGNRSAQAVDQLRIVTRGLLGVAIPTQICTSDDDYQFSEDGNSCSIRQEKLEERVSRFVAEMMAFTRLLKPMRID